MKIETQRLLIRDVKTEDEVPYINMASDGSLNDCGFDVNCSRWITKWIAEAKEFAARNHPDRDYLAYTIALKGEATVIGSIGCSYYDDLRETGVTFFVGSQYRGNGYATEAVRAYTDYFLQHYHTGKLIATVRDENTPSWKAVEKAGFILKKKRMYRDVNDADEQLYRFYEIAKRI